MLVFEASDVFGAAANGAGYHKGGWIRFPDLIRVDQCGQIQILFSAAFSLRFVVFSFYIHIDTPQTY